MKANVETRRDEYTFLGSGCNIRTHLLRAAARPRVYFVEIWARGGLREERTVRMRPGGKSNGESPFFETPNLSFEGRVGILALCGVPHGRVPRGGSRAPRRAPTKRRATPPGAGVPRRARPAARRRPTARPATRTARARPHAYPLPHGRAAARLGPFAFRECGVCKLSAQPCCRRLAPIHITGRQCGSTSYCTPTARAARESDHRWTRTATPSRAQGACLHHPRSLHAAGARHTLRRVCATCVRGPRRACLDNTRNGP